MMFDPIRILMLGALALAVTGTAPVHAQEAVDAEATVMLRLRSGDIHFGTIAEHDPDGIWFTLLSHGGTARVGWSLIDSSQELELRTRFGYVDVSSEEYLIPATRYVLLDGSELVGVRTDRVPDAQVYKVKVDGNLVALPRNRIRTVESGVMVPALDVYSREEAYETIKTSADPTDPDSLWQLANDCERILDFAHAAEHYRELDALDPSYRQEAVGAKLAAAERKAEQQEQIDYLREIDKLRKKKAYARALAMCEAFGDTFPSSPLYEEANKKKFQVQIARDKELTEVVKREWFRWMGRLAREAAMEMTYAEAVDYASEALSNDIVTKVTEVLVERGYEGLEAEQVRSYFDKRRKVRWTTASYGKGTWLLGPEDAQKGMEEEKSSDAPESEVAQQRADFQKKLERYLKSQQAARKARRSQDDSEDYEAFWETFTVNDRSKWIVAAYVESGGDLEVNPKPRLLACDTCGGQGAREVIYAGGGSSDTTSGSHLVACPTCHRVKVVRQVRYR